MPRAHPGTGQVHSGQVFANWTVIAQAENDGPNRRWNVLCKCGKTKRVSEYKLVSGKSTQCRGCSGVVEDLIGKTFGGLEVVERLTHGPGGKIWLARCTHCQAPRAYGVSELRRNTTGCRKCMMGWSNPAVRRRPYEALYNAFKQRQEKWEGRVVEITYEDFCEFTEQKNCHYCYAPLEWSMFNPAGRNRKRGGIKNNKYYLDRKDNSKDYVKGNLVVCCTRCNYARGNRYSYEDWWGMTAYLRSKAKSARKATTPESRTQLVLAATAAK